MPQQTIIVLGINKLVDNVFADMKRIMKVHQEVAYYTELYYQSIPLK